MGTGFGSARTGSGRHFVYIESGEGFTGIRPLRLSCYWISNLTVVPLSQLVSSHAVEFTK